MKTANFCSHGACGPGRFSRDMALACASLIRLRAQGQLNQCSCLLRQHQVFISIRVYYSEGSDVNCRESQGYARSPVDKQISAKT